MRLVTFFLTLLAAADVFAAPLLDGGGGHVAAIVSGDTLALEDGRTVRLAGILAPAPPPGWPAETPWRMAEASRTALAEIALGRTVTLRRGGIEQDRYGRFLAHLWREDGIWLQGELLRRGMARVASSAESRALVPELLAIEEAARNARRGLWSDRSYAVRRAAEAGHFIESFELVQGRVMSESHLKGQLVLALASEDDGTSDGLTLRLSREAQALFKAEGTDPRDLVGASLRVRGWIAFDRRPLIDVTHPEQIERLPRP